jgi:hypothetical protein
VDHRYKVVPHTDCGKILLEIPISAGPLLNSNEWRMILKKMLKRIAFLLVAAVLAFPPGASSQTGSQPGTDFPQAQPILQMLRAVEAGDAEGLINCYAAKAKESLVAKYGKEQLLDFHRQLFVIIHLYPFKTENFTFAYRPRNGSSGRIAYYYNGEKVKNTGSVVRLEGGEWKIEE